MWPALDIWNKTDIIIDREEKEEERLWAVWGWQYILVKRLVMLMWIRAFNLEPETSSN